MSLKEVLQNPAIGGFDEVKVVSNASLVPVQRALANFRSNRASADTILLYFTGHGLLDEDGKLWLAMSESDPAAPNVGSLEAEYVQNTLKRCPALCQLLILDCCHSGAIEKELSYGISRAKDGPVRQAIVKDTFDADGLGRYVMASSAATQQSFEINSRSVFTRAIVDGLKTGKAAPDKENITFDDLANFAIRAAHAS